MKLNNMKINLEEILFAEVDNFRKHYPNDNMYSNDEMKKTPEWPFFINAMKEACRQTLELAAENAETEKEMLPECGVLKSVGVVDKQSILDTINQIQ